MKFKIFILFLFLSFSRLFSFEPKDYTIEVTASPDIQNSSITIQWSSISDTNKYIVSRKSLKNNKIVWEQRAINITRNSFIDTYLPDKTGILEYRVESIRDSNCTAYGYVATSLRPINQNATKNLLLLVDEYVYSNLKEKIREYKNLFIADGYYTILRTVPRAEIFDSADVRYVKWLCDEVRKSYNLDYIVLFGRVPVPYSGSEAIDGHTDHIGAWPCDNYYTSRFKYWSDTTVTATKATDPRNHNIPADGKFDQIFSYDSINTAISRIDFYDLPAFDKSELELYSEYIDKICDYKKCKLQFDNRALIVDKFHTAYQEIQSVEAWLNYRTLFGDNNLDTADVYVPTLSEKSYLMAYACNSGGYNSLMNTIYTEDFAKYNLKAAISCFMGSYLADWDSRDNLLRGAIASQNVLNSYFGGRPFWFLHKMGIGNTIGDAYNLTINNGSTFYRSTHIYGFRMLHIALMGDPTITLYPILPAESVTQENLENCITIAWSLQQDSKQLVNIYRSNNIDSTFELINSRPLSQAESPYFDYSGSDTCVYMVRTLPADSLIQTRSGTFYREGIGVFSDKSEAVKTIRQKQFIGFPNPAKDIITFNHAKGSIDIYNTLGIKVLTSLDLQVNISDLPNGLYYAKSNDKRCSFVIYR